MTFVFWLGDPLWRPGSAAWRGVRYARIWVWRRAQLLLEAVSVLHRPCLANEQSAHPALLAQAARSAIVCPLYG